VSTGADPGNSDTGDSDTGDSDTGNFKEDDPQAEATLPTPYERVESFLSACSDTEMDDLPAQDVTARASELAALVDEMLVAIQAEDDQQDKFAATGSRTATHIPNDVLSWDLPSGDISKKEISNERAAECDGHSRFHGQELVESDSDRIEAPAIDVEGLKMTDNEVDRTIDSLQADTPLMMAHSAHSGDAVHSGGSGGADSLQAAHDSAIVKTQGNMAPVFLTVSPHEEALRHLLHHLKETRNKA